MNNRKLLLTLLVITLFILTTVPASAGSADLTDTGIQGSTYSTDFDVKKNAFSLSSDIDDYYDCTLTKNSDGNDTYTLEIKCRENRTTININGYCRELYSEWKDKITRVIIADGAQKIDNYSFYQFGSLRSVTLPGSVTEIGYASFSNCFCLTDIDLSRVTAVGVSAFNNCGPNSFLFNFNPSISDNEKVLACSPAINNKVRPDAPEGTTSTDQYLEAYAEVRNILSEMDLDGKSDIEKVKTIYEWIIANVEYDDEALDHDPKSSRYGYAGTIHSAVFAHKAICEGYAVLLKTMLNSAGVSSLYRSGDTFFGAHAWDMISIDGKWYLADPTWDDTEEEYDRLPRPFSFEYFLRSYEFFYSESDHYWPDETEVFKSCYPLSAADYYQVIDSGDYRFLLAEDSALLLKYKGKDSSLTLPKTVSYSGRTYQIVLIGPYAFNERSKLKKVIIPEGYIHICSTAFYECHNISDLKLPSTIRKIEEYAFMYSAPDKVTFNGSSEQFKAIDIEKNNYDFCSKTIKCTDKDFKDPRDLMRAKVKLSAKNFVYNGEYQFPEIEVTTSDGKVLKENVDYILRSFNYEELIPNKDVNNYRVEIVGIGNYSRFMREIEYNIIPVPTKLSKLKAGKKALTAYWNKKTVQVTGYQVQYTWDRKFKYNVKTLKVKGCKNGSVKIKKLKSGQKYYVRVRTYKYVTGSYTGTIYSSWSKARKIKVK